MRTLYLMCGVPGSGKSTWISCHNTSGAVVSRDAIRYGLVDEKEGYFSRENEVFDQFIYNINAELLKTGIVYADATHLSEKSRNMVLDKITVKDVDIVPISFNVSLETCLKRNQNRVGRANVPESAIRRMFNSYSAPTMNEKHKYKEIIEVGE